MQLRQFISTTVVILVGASLLAGSASAGGEPKNEWPFTRSVGARATQVATQPRSTVQPAVQGEPKNEPPFTRPTTLVVQSGRGFDWTDAGVGLVAGIGIAAIGAGALSLRPTKSPQTA